MKRTVWAAALAVTFVLTGCNTQTTKEAAAPGADQAAYEAALANAKAEQKKAAAMGGEWRDTGTMIKNAESAAAAGDYAKAKKLADQAAAQGRIGQQQAAEQANVGNPAYLY